MYVDMYVRHAVRLDTRDSDCAAQIVSHLFPNASPLLSRGSKREPLSLNVIQTDRLNEVLVLVAEFSYRLSNTLTS